jgi:hypothetical protein
VLQGAGRLLLGEVEDQIGGREEARGMAREDRLMDEILGHHGFAQPVGSNDALREDVEREDAFDGRTMNLGRPVPFEIGHHLEAAQTRVLQDRAAPGRCRASAIAEKMAQASSAPPRLVEVPLPPNTPPQ